MAKYIEFRTKQFNLKKDARAWAEKTKAEYKQAGIQMKIETNYLPQLNMWEGIVLMKENNGGENRRT